MAEPTGPAEDRGKRRLEVNSLKLGRKPGSILRPTDTEQPAAAE